MIVGKIRVENFRGMSLGLYDENNRLHATAVTERADLQAICDGYNAMLDVQAIGGQDDDAPVDPADMVPAFEGPVVGFQQTEKRGRGRPRKG